MKKYLFLLFLFIPLTAYPATYDYYFSTSGGGSTCSEVSPCAYVSSNEYGYSSGTTAQDKIDALSSTDTVNLYFKKGDTWEFDTAAVSPTAIYGLDVSSTGPIINIDSYGTGNDPIFDGRVTDFSTVNNHNATTGPSMWNAIFRIMSDGSSIKNIKITKVYGSGIRIGSNVDYGDNMTIESCEISYYGFAGIVASATYGTRNSTITKNLIYNGGNLYMNDKTPGNDAAYAISIAPVWATTRGAANNVISYNVIYDTAGEGIHGNGATVEYNIVGDTGSVGIYCNPFKQTANDHIIRYNLVTFSNTASSAYTNSNGYASYDGIEIRDEGDGGDNSSATAQVYGNVVINRKLGIVFAAGQGDEVWKEVRIFNNTIIDSTNRNIYIGNYNTVAAGKGFIYNNVSILYDNVGGSHVLDHNDPEDFSTYWTVDNNAYWTTGGSPTVDEDWRTNYVVTNPLLAGEEQGSPVDWDGQTTGDPRGKITFDNIVPESGSSLINSGKTLTYDATFLVSSSDFAVLPDTQTFYTGEQGDHTSWEIGAAISATLQVTNVSPADSETDVATDKTATWDCLWIADVYLDKGTCAAVAKTTLVSSNNASGSYGMSLDANSTYCLVLVAHDGTTYGSDQEFEFATQQSAADWQTLLGNTFPIAETFDNRSDWTATASNNACAYAGPTGTIFGRHCVYNRTSEDAKDPSLDVFAGKVVSGKGFRFNWMGNGEGMQDTSTVRAYFGDDTVTGGYDPIYIFFMMYYPSDRLPTETLTIGADSRYPARRVQGDDNLRTVSNKMLMIGMGFTAINEWGGVISPEDSNGACRWGWSENHLFFFSQKGESDDYEIRTLLGDGGAGTYGQFIGDVDVSGWLDTQMWVEIMLDRETTIGSSSDGAVKVTFYDSNGDGTEVLSRTGVNILDPDGGCETASGVSETVGNTMKFNMFNFESNQRVYDPNDRYIRCEDLYDSGDQYVRALDCYWYIDDLIIDDSSIASTYFSLYGGSPPGDTTAPVMSAGYPSGTISCESDPMSIEEGLTTNEAAVCKNNDADVAYGSMAAIDSSGGTSHSDSVSRACGASYTKYYRCADGYSNTNDTSLAVTYTIGAVAPPPNPPSTKGFSFGGGGIGSLP